jgi:lipopolysaccharide transport system ATP-binding protein
MRRKAIEVVNLGKEYSIGEKIRYDTLRDSITRVVTDTFSQLSSRIRKRPGYENTNKSSLRGTDIIAQQTNPTNGSQGTSNYIWSLKNVSFDVSEGEIVGIIGRNGAGKSTLLKIISGITEPTEGIINIYGRIGSLLEVGTGFHPELTGRENIFLNGAILGMRRWEIERKFDEIVDFSGVEKFIDTPVKFYSSGMRVRLGFAVAAHLEPDILLLDEVLAVGDATFQKKCLGKLDNVATSEGRTVLFVSHDLAAISSLCQRVVMLEDGKVKAIGPAEEIVDQYLKSLSLIEEISLTERTDIDPNSDRSIIATFIEIENMDHGKPIRPSSRIIIKVGYKSETPVKNLIVSLAIRDFKTGYPITVLWSNDSDNIPPTLPNEGTIVCTTNKLLITSGKCYVDILFWKGTHLVYKLERASHFTVEAEAVYGEDIPRKHSMFLLDHEWSIEGNQ